mgnify:CR=1 FL=1
MEIGKVIRKERLDRNMTQKELGLLLGYGEDSAQVRVSSFERGQKAPRKKIKKLAELLGIPIELLIDPPRQMGDYQSTGSNR